MTNIVSGLVALVFGGYILLMFGNVVLQSFRDKRVRDHLLSAPRLRNPTRLHKVIFAAMAALLLAFSIMMIARGVSDLGA